MKKLKIALLALWLLIHVTALLLLLLAGVWWALPAVFVLMLFGYHPEIRWLIKGLRTVRREESYWKDTRVIGFGLSWEDWHIREVRFWLDLWKPSYSWHFTFPTTSAR